MSVAINDMVPLFDSSGDISDETAHAIRDYHGPPELWFEFCIQCWDTNYGKIERVTTVDGKGLRFITGGWSCNEGVIAEMQENRIMWAMYWESIVRGGLFTFEYPDEN